MGVVPEPLIPYLVLVFNSVVFKVLRVLGRRLPIPNAEPFLGEFIATLELCTGCGELGVIYEAQGVLAMAVALFLLCLWWSVSFENAEACNTAIIEDVVVEGKIDKHEFLQRHFGMILGALATSWYNKSIWAFHMTEEHTAMHTATECIAGLRVTAFEGALIEGLLSFLSRLIAMETADLSFKKAALANSFACTVLVVAGLEYTGGFFNPILALAFNFGCKGNTYLEYVVVYWLGALVGGVLARVVHNSVVLALKGGIKRVHIRAD